MLAAAAGTELSHHSPVAAAARGAGRANPLPSLPFQLP